MAHFLFPGALPPIHPLDGLFSHGSLSYSEKVLVMGGGGYINGFLGNWTYTQSRAIYE